MATMGAMPGLGSLPGTTTSTDGLGIANYAAYYLYNNGAYSTQTITTTTIQNDVIWGAWNRYYAIAGQSCQAIQTGPLNNTVRNADCEGRLNALVEEQLRHENKWTQAAEKARSLLLSVLSKDQREQYARDHSFDVIVADKAGEQTKYRIRQGRAGNIDRLHQGRSIERLCIHVNEDIPIEDNLVAQKFALEADEMGFRSVANITKIAA